MRALAADPGGRFVAVGLATGAIELRAIDSGALIESFHTHDSAVVALTFSRDGRLVAAWDDGQVATLPFEQGGS